MLKLGPKIINCFRTNLLKTTNYIVSNKMADVSRGSKRPRFTKKKLSKVEDTVDISMQFSMPDAIVNVLMARAREDTSNINYLRSVCAPAQIWIPFLPRKRTQGFALSRKLIITGHAQDVVDNR